MLAVHSGWAQYSQKYTNKKNEAYTDSLKRTEYPYIFPVLGAKTRKLGFEIPLPHGIMLNGLWNKQDVLLQDLEVAFNDGQYISLDSIVNFDRVTVNSLGTNLRFDTYIFPFLNVYGLLGTINTKTSLKITEPVNIENTTTNNGMYYGFGVMAAGGLGPLFIQGDFSMAWSKLALLDKANSGSNMGLRVGHAFKIPNHPRQNIALWIGANRQAIQSNTSGSISLYEAIGADEDKVAEAQQKLSDVSDRIQKWYDDLPPALQPKFEDQVTKITNGLNRVSDGLEDPQVSYRFQKQLKRKWHFMVGAQWQISPNWQVRAEYGFADQKQQALLSLNYRFGIRGHNLWSGKQEDDTDTKGSPAFAF